MRDAIGQDLLNINDLHGRGGGIRTPDPLLPKQMRYQTALRPDGMLRLYREMVFSWRMPAGRGAGLMRLVKHDPADEPDGS